MDRDKISNLYKGPSIDAFYQVSVHLAEGFQRRRLKCEKLTDDGRQVKAKAELALNNNHSFTQSLLSSKRAMVLFTQNNVLFQPRRKDWVHKTSFLHTSFFFVSLFFI
jgi:hypothetical protein